MRGCSILAFSCFASFNLLGNLDFYIRLSYKHELAHFYFELFKFAHMFYRFASIFNC